MGKILQIRVSARTFKPEDVEKAWPALFDLAVKHGPGGEKPFKGVLELIDLLHDYVRFELDDKKLKSLLEPELKKIVDIKTGLENALSDWDPQKADALSYDLEDALSELESRLARARKDMGE